jgi:hypothetical protein
LAAHQPHADEGIGIARVGELAHGTGHQAAERHVPAADPLDALIGGGRRGGTRGSVVRALDEYS